MIYFTADQHFGHRNVIRFCDRPFATVEEMDAALMESWNSRVTGGDTVFVLGDMFYRAQDPEAVLRQLRGKKRLVVGNHDASWMGRVELSKYFESVDSFLEINDGQRALTLCHYPMVTWRHSGRDNSFMIHGHIHNDTRADFWPLLVKREQILNAGVELNGYRPVTFNELWENNFLFKQERPGASVSSAI